MVASIGTVYSEDYFLKTLETRSKSNSGKMLEYMDGKTLVDPSSSKNEQDEARKRQLENEELGISPTYFFGLNTHEYGVKNGDTVDADQWNNLFWGMTPDGSQKLTRNAKGYEDTTEIGKDGKPLNEREVFVRDQSTIVKLNRQINLLKSKNPTSADITTLQAQVDALKKKNQPHRPFADVTFSVPKTVSNIYVMADEETRKKIIKAQTQAVEKTVLRMFQQMYLGRTTIYDPITGDSKTVAELVRSALCTISTHIDARPVEREGEIQAPDCHIHCHVTIANGIKLLAEQDDKFKALYTDYIKNNLKALGAEHTARLAQELRGIGLEVEEEQKKNSTGPASFHIKGVNKEFPIRTSRRTDDVAKNKSRIHKLDMTNKEILDAQRLRFGSSPEFSKNWFYFDFSQHRSEPVRRGPKKNKNNTSSHPKQKMEKEIFDGLLAMRGSFTLAEIREAIFTEMIHYDLSQLKNIVGKESRQMSQDQLFDLAFEMKFKRMLSYEDLATALNPKSDIFRETHYTLKSTAKMDESILPIALSIRAHTHRGFKPLDTHRLEKRLNTGGDLHNTLGFNLNLEQVQMVKNLVGTNESVAFVNAMAGTGKTTSATVAVNLWREEGYQVLGLCQTWAASKQFKKDCSEKTLPHLKKSFDEQVQVSVPEVILQKLKEGKTIADILKSNKAIVYIDEASMVGSHNMALLLDQIDKENQAGAQFKIVMQGDPEQLSAVARGNPYQRLMESKQFAVSTLTTITRQKEDWSRQATMLAETGDIRRAFELYKDPAARLEWLKKYHADHDLPFEPSDEELAHIQRQCVFKHINKREQVEDIARRYVECTDPIQKRMALGSLTNDVEALNQAIQQKRIERGEVKKPHELILGRAGREKVMRLGIGDRIKFTEKVTAEQVDSFLARLETVRLALTGKRKKQEQKENNTSTATVTKVKQCKDKSYDISYFSDEHQSTFTINTKNTASIDLNYASTIHSSQGQTKSSVWYLASSFINSSLAVVALSRHTHNLQIFMSESDEDAHSQSSEDLWLEKAAQKEVKTQADDLIKQRSDQEHQEEIQGYYKRFYKAFGKDSAPNPALHTVLFGALPHEPVLEPLKDVVQQFTSPSVLPAQLPLSIPEVPASALTYPILTPLSNWNANPLPTLTLNYPAPRPLFSFIPSVQPIQVEVPDYSEVITNLAATNQELKVEVNKPITREEKIKKTRAWLEDLYVRLDNINPPCVDDANKALSGLKKLLKLEVFDVQETYKGVEHIVKAVVEKRLDPTTTDDMVKDLLYFSAELMVWSKNTDIFKTISPLIEPGAGRFHAYFKMQCIPATENVKSVKDLPLLLGYCTLFKDYSILKPYLRSDNTPAVKSVEKGLKWVHSEQGIGFFINDRYEPCCARLNQNFVADPKQKYEITYRKDGKWDISVEHIQKKTQQQEHGGRHL